MSTTRAPTNPSYDEGIVKSADYLKSLVDAEVAAGVPAEKVLVGGFSQGGAIALTMAEPRPCRLNTSG